MRGWPFLVIATMGCATVDGTPSPERDPSPATGFPGHHWEPVTSPEAEGYSTTKLQAVRTFLAGLDTTAAMVIVHGRVLLQYGDVARVSYVASVRKSILGMLLGEHVARGEIHETSTLAQLGIDDVGGLTMEEKQATVADLLAARSGVYHAASNPGDDLKDAPVRGSKRPGAWSLYSNWDFNVLGTIFEEQAHEGIYDALERELAQPIGMEDFARSRQQKSGDAAISVHLAYHIDLSTRDMARLGYLMLRASSWGGWELVPRDWVTELTTPTSRAEEVHGYEKWGMGYGKLWWLFDDPRARAGGTLQGAYSAIGAYGQFISIVPKLDMVIAHKVVHKANEDVGVAAYRQLVEAIVACRRDDD